MLRRLTRKHSEQTRSQLSSQDAVNYITLNLFSTILLVRDTIENQFIRGLFHNFRDTTHDLWDRGPRQRGNQDTNHPAVTTSQPGRGDAGHECLLFHDALDALTCARVYIRLLIQHSRDGGLRYTSYSSDVAYRNFLHHDDPF